MRISRVKIDNYGPVRDVDWDLGEGMTLFFGANESGKTLVVEAIIKLLLGTGAEDIPAIDRVTGHPAGFLLVERNGTAVQLPDAKFTDLFPEEVDRADVRNAFVIRDYDLRLPERRADFGHSAYLRDVSDRIMGSQTQEIESVTARIADLGNLANERSERLMNRKPEKLKSRRDAAETLAEELEDYLRECREEGILATARSKRDQEIELDHVEREIAELRAAERREQLERGRALLDDLREVEKDIANHADRESEIETYEALRSDIETYRNSGAANGVTPGTYAWAGALLAPALAASVIATVATQLWSMGMLVTVLLPIIATVLLIATLYAGYKYFDTRDRLREGETLVEDANYVGIDGDDLPTVYTQLEAAVEDYHEKGEHLSSKRGRVLGQLHGSFGCSHDSVEDWQAEIDAFSEDVEDVERDYDENELQRLQDKRGQLQDDINTARRALGQHRELLTYYDGKLNDIRPEEHLPDVDEVGVRSVEDLRTAITVLERFVSELDDRRDIARVAIDIFEDLADEEEREIDRLFRTDDFVVESFREITDGNYVDVWYDEDRGVRVERVDGRECSPHELSQGTYDLLYLTVRLKLAQELLGAGPGFLVLDDAFIHSDPDRTAREIEILDDLAAEDWQIVYFSVREAVREAVESADHGHVHELDRLAFGP